MREIVVALNLFDYAQNVFAFEDGQLIMKVTVPMQDLAEAVVATAYQKDTANVTLHGQSTYAEKIAEDIRSQEQLKYQRQDIQVTIAE